MPRSSKHKSHRQSKHSVKDAREQSASEEDVKMKDRTSKEDGSVRVSRDSGSSEKRKLSLGKDGDKSEDNVASKRRKEKADVSAASDRWNGVEREMKGEKSSKTDPDKTSKPAIDSKSRSSRKHDSGSEKRVEIVDIAAEKEENKRVDSKRKSEKDSGPKEVKDSNESKDKERGSEREREKEREKKIQDMKGETEARAVGNDAARKRGTDVADLGEERLGKRGRENTDIQDELRNPELERELDKRMRRRRDGSSDKDKYVEVKESEDRRLSSKGDKNKYQEPKESEDRKVERAKDGRYKDEKRKDGSYGGKHREDVDRESRKRDDKYREDAERESRHRDDKYREDAERDSRHRDDKYREEGDRDSRKKDDKYQRDGERDNRHRDNKHREDGNRDNKHRDHKYQDDGDRDNSRRDDKYREDGGRDIGNRGDKYREDGDRDGRYRDDKYRDNGERDDRRKDDLHIEDGNRDIRNREEKNWEDGGRDGRHRVGKQRDDNDKDKRLRDVRYQDERSSRDWSSDKSDIKRLMDESNAVDLDYRKSNNRDGSPFYDDWSTRYKDDKGRRTSGDKDDRVDIRSRSTKEQHSDTAKKSMSSARVELVSDRGRSNAHNNEVESTPNHSRRRSSPSSSSHAGKDNYRVVKQEESKHRDYVHEERFRHDMTSSKEFAGFAGVTEKASLSRSIEKSLQKDDSRVGELSAERRPKVDARTSPLQVVEKSPSSMSNDHRHLNRSGVRRSLDIEDSGQRSGGSMDARDYFGREGRGSRDMAMEAVQGDELSQADGDNLSVSSPFNRTGHLSSNSRSLLPRPPFRMGADSHLVLGSLEDDNRGKSNNRHRRIGDPNMGRVQGSAWRGFPNWPSPVANGFMPFQHGPPPVGFHPVMQQFPAPPMFSVRPSMELNQSGVPYHLPDASRISGQGRPLGWRNQVDDSCPPSIHGWDANNTVLGDEFHIYERLDRDHSRTPAGGRVWETSGDIWRGQSSGPSTEFSPAPQKEDYSARGPADEVLASQSVLHAQNDKNQPGVLAENIDIDESSDTREGNVLEDPKTTSGEMANLSRKDDTCLSHIYLSVLDISADLTEPELYGEFASLMGVDQNKDFEEDDSKFLFMEDTVHATTEIPNETSSAPLFSNINDSVFQKAMSLYKKLRGEAGAITGDKVLYGNVENLESAPQLDLEGGVPYNDKPGEVVPFGDVENLKSAPPLNPEGEGPYNDVPGEVVPASDEQGAAVVVSALNKVKIEVSPAIMDEKIDEPVLADSLEKSEEPNAASSKVKMECDAVPKEAALDYMVEGNSSCPENVEPSYVCSPGTVEESRRVSDYAGSHSATSNDGQNLRDAKYAPLLFSDVSAEACEAVMPESIESGSVNLSRIHQSPESTH